VPRPALTVGAGPNVTSSLYELGGGAVGGVGGTEMDTAVAKVAPQHKAPGSGRKGGGSSSNSDSNNNNNNNNNSNSFSGPGPFLSLAELERSLLSHNKPDEGPVPLGQGMRKIEFPFGSER